MAWTIRITPKDDDCFDVICEEYEIDTATLILRKRKAGDTQIYQVFPLHRVVEITATETLG